MKLSPFGKEIRRIRLDQEITLLEMARRLGVSSAFASAVEVGSKKVPDDYPARVAVALNLSDEIAEELERLARTSVPEVRIGFGRGTQQHEREVAQMFARRFGELDGEQFESIRKILEEER